MSDDVPTPEQIREIGRRAAQFGGTGYAPGWQRVVDISRTDSEPLPIGDAPTDAHPDYALIVEGVSVSMGGTAKAWTATCCADECDACHRLVQPLLGVLIGKGEYACLLLCRDCVMRAFAIVAPTDAPLTHEDVALLRELADREGIGLDAHCDLLETAARIAALLPDPT